MLNTHGTIGESCCAALFGLILVLLSSYSGKATATTQAVGAPTISSFRPSSGPVGTVITVTGTNLSGSTAAWVGSAHDAGVTNISSTSMQMTVPTDAPVASDQLAIVTPGGTVWSGQNFTVTTGSGSAPAAPTNLANSVISSSQINLTWTASTGATGYVVQRCSGASCTSFAQIGATTTTSYSNTGLTASTSYTYRVEATNTAGSSGFSNTTTGTTTVALPTAPSNLANSVISSSQINLTWTASTAGATGYTVQRCQGGSCTSFAQVGTSTTTSYSDTGLTASTNYSYRVEATNAAGSSGFSNTVSGTTPARTTTPPPVITSPISGTTVLTGQSLTISANISAGAFPSGVALLAEDPLGSAAIQAVSGSAVSFILPIPPNTPSGSHLITVVGVNSAGAVIPSAQLSVDVEQANQPSALSAYPSAVTMASVGDTRSLTVLGSFPGNLQIDISKSSKLTFLSANAGIATVQSGTITAVASGLTGIVIQYGPATIVIPVTVP